MDEDPLDRPGQRRRINGSTRLHDGALVLPARLRPQPHRRGVNRTGGSPEYVTPTQTRITLGAWSWAGIAGLLATFDADITVIEPDELKAACRTLARRYRQASEPTEDGTGDRNVEEVVR